MFQSPPFQPNSLFSSIYSSTVNHQQQQFFLQCFHQQQQAMAQFFNPFFFLSANQNFMNGHHHEQQQRCRRQNALQYPPTFNPATSMSSFNPTKTAAPWMRTNSSPLNFGSSSASHGGSIKEAATCARDIFFKTLSISLKDAHQHFNNNGKTGANWKNPFLYKTTLCHNYTKRTFCRFGVNCWFAHGHHELRCIPDSKELPDPAFITRYLSFLGLPPQLLEQMIHTAYSAASNRSSPPSPSSSNAASPCSSANSCFLASTSQQSTDHFSFFPSPLSHSPIKAIAASTPNSTAIFHPKFNEDKFYSSLTSNLGVCGWDNIEPAYNKGVVDVKTENDDNGNGKPLNDLYDHVYHLFGAIGNPW